jgi:hypothetical protein
MSVPRRIVPLFLVAAVIAGVWAGNQLYAVFAGS